MIISDVVAKALCMGKAVVIIDTCSILDVVRSGHRAGLEPRDIVFVDNYNKTLEADREFYGIISNVSVDEFNRHIINTADDLRNNLKGLANKLTPAITMLESLPNYNGSSLINISSQEIESVIVEILSISNDFVRNLDEIDRDPSLYDKAYMRNVNAIAPASPGKNEFNDCMITEHILELARRLRSSGFSKKIIFVSSNKADYGSTGKLKPELDAEFRPLGIEFSGDFRVAMHFAASNYPS